MRVQIVYVGPTRSASMQQQGVGLYKDSMGASDLFSGFQRKNESYKKCEQKPDHAQILSVHCRDIK